MVGDTKFDVLGAKHHGIPCIGVSWGYGTVEDMENAGAAAIVHTPDELLKLLLA
jgi:phosphoglycolate phosphatase